MTRTISDDARKLFCEDWRSEVSESIPEDRNCIIYYLIYKLHYLKTTDTLNINRIYAWVDYYI